MCRDARGRLSSITQGARTQTIAYRTDGWTDSITDALLQTTTFTPDGAGRVLQQTLADGTTTKFGYDANGNVTSVTPPTKPAHGMGYTPVDLLGSYDPPPVSGAGIDGGAANTAFGYDLDRMLRTTTRPDGVQVVRTPDSAGRLSTVTLPTGTITYGYSPTTGKLTSVTGPDGEIVGFGYDGHLLTDIAYSGVIPGAVHMTYNADFRVTQETVNGSLAASFGYDNDGILTAAGSETLIPSPTTGLLTGTTLGGATDTYTPDGFGALLAYAAQFGSTALFSENVTLRDNLGRIRTKTEIVQGRTHAYEYSYDVPGRLTVVKVDGAQAAHYGYDANGNRTTKVTSDGTLNGTPDDQDRLLSYGANAYSYGPNGELATKTADGQTMSYAFDALGNLKHVGLPGGPAVDYLVDGLGRRIAKVVNGTTVAGFLWRDQLRLVAQTDAAGSVVSRFVYGTRPNVPEYMVKGTDTYRLFTDHLGSVRLVVKVSDGTVAQRIDYDEFGVVTGDTNPGFQPFGFAGGLYDPDTKLVRFGARDYDAETGRWISRDPILFNGGQGNFYEYVLGDPVNGTDPDGQQAAVPIPFPVPAPAIVTGIVGTLVCMAIPSCRDFITKVTKKVVDTCTDLTKSEPKKGCPPCPEPPPDDSRTDVGHAHWPCPGAHIHHYSYEYNQDPVSCECFLKKVESGVDCL